MRNLYAPPHFIIQDQIKKALYEDFGHGFDLTSQTVLPKKTHANVNMVARQDLILSGLDWGIHALKTLDPNLKIETLKQDSMLIQQGETLLKVSGDARAIMSAERVCLNFIGHLSGIATYTNLFIKKIQATNAKITCTRKTLPFLRNAEKYAVRCGGGITHRSGLDDAILIKDNHIGVCGSVEQAVKNARQSIGHTTKIEVECDTFEQFTQALNVRADIIMLDNMSPDQLKNCVNYQTKQRQESGIILEASGGVTLETVEAIAQTGIDVISIGSLTHSAPNADIAFDFISLI